MVLLVVLNILGLDFNVLNEKFGYPHLFSDKLNLLYALDLISQGIFDPNAHLSKCSACGGELEELLLKFGVSRDTLAKLQGALRGVSPSQLMFYPRGELLAGLRSTSEKISLKKALDKLKRIHDKCVDRS